MVALPAADWAYDYAGIGKSADAVVLMNYDSTGGLRRRVPLPRKIGS